MQNLKHFEKLAAEDFGLVLESPAESISAGNINRTAVVRSSSGVFVLQDINTSVFVDPAALMANVAMIVERQRRQSIPAIELRPTTTGELLARSEGSFWRCYAFIEGHATPPITSRNEAQATARAFGRFAKAIDGLELVEHLPGYHDFDSRVDAFVDAVETDKVGRLNDCEQQVQDLMAMTDRLRLTSAYGLWGGLPIRNAHNDAKGPNCIIGVVGRTIIDLDTTMPGTVLSDIGELVRSSTREMGNAGPEELMRQITSVNRGFIAGFGDGLTAEEHDCMLLAGPLLALENALRFTADHLAGDVYYGADTPDQNLERGAVQLELAQRLVAAIELATSGWLTGN